MFPCAFGLAAQGRLMKVAAIFPVGTSDSGAPTAISEILKEESAIDVYLLFGKQGSADTPDPKDSVARIKQTVTGSRVTWAAEQEIEPHDFSETYSQIRAFISGLAEKRYDRVWVGITGGTNPMVTSLFQTAMAYLPCQVIPIYIQSKGVTLIRHFAASDVRDSVLAEDVLTTARSGQVRLAAKLAEKLPNEGRWKFLRSSLAGLAYWDDFDYLEAMEHLKMPARNAAAFSADKALAPLADTLTRIAADARQMADFTKDISAVDRFAGSVLKSGWEDKVYRYGILLVGDVLANAQRRIVEGRFTVQETALSITLLGFRSRRFTCGLSLPVPGAVSGRRARRLCGRGRRWAWPIPGIYL
jgi:hypothetical protein